MRRLERKRAFVKPGSLQWAFENVLDSCIGAVALARPEGTLTYVNKAFVKLWGRDALIPLGRAAIQDFWESREKCAEALKAVHAGRGWIGEFTAKREDGSTLHVHASLNMVTGGGGAPMSVMGSFVDITERKNAEEALQRSEGRLRSILASMADLVLVFDREGRYAPGLHVPSSRALYVSPEDFIGKKWSEVLPPELHAIMSEAFDKVERGEVAEFEYPLTVMGGPAWFSAKLSPQYSGNERVGAIAVIRDITERKKAEDERRANERFLQSIFDGLQDGLSILDRDLNVLRVNNWVERLHSSTRLVGKKCYAAYRGRTSPCARCPSVRAIRSGKTETDVTPLPRAAGRAGWLSLSSHPWKNESGEIIGVIEHVKDVTKAKEADERRIQSEAALVQAQKLASVGQLAAGVAHEINNPLSALSGEIQLLSKKTGNKAVVKSLKFMDKVSKRIAGIIAQLLTFSRETSPGAREPVGINDVVENALELMERRVENGGVKVVKKLGRGLPGLVVNRGQLEQVLINVLANSLDAMPDGGRISITTRRRKVKDGRSGATVMVVVQDNGVGIPQENLARVFDPFFTTKPPGKGVGLGLSVSHGIMLSHGGLIEIDSAPGKGARVSIALPVAASRSNGRPGAKAGIMSRSRR